MWRVARCLLVAGLAVMLPYSAAHPHSDEAEGDKTPV